MSSRTRIVILVALLALAIRVDAQHPPLKTRVYEVTQTAKLSDIPSGAKKVVWWVAIPNDERAQDVLDFSVVSVPGPWTTVREPDYGNRFLKIEIDAPAATEYEAKVSFTLRRRPVQVDIDPAKVGPLTASHRGLFANELRLDAPHMVVTPAIKQMADAACGDDQNLATQAKKLLAAVAAHADHYGKDKTKPASGVGDASACHANKGGTCTDLHSLFIATARSRGIPARLQMGYRLREQNDGKEVDPGYRCWAEYFLPGIGWVPTDVVEADADGGLGPEVWFKGLTERRLWLNEGREFDLQGRANSTRVNTMVIGYAEVDGRPVRVIPEGELKAQMSRTVFYREIAASGDDAAR